MKKIIKIGLSILLTGIVLFNLSSPVLAREVNDPPIVVHSSSRGN